MEEAGGKNAQDISILKLTASLNYFKVRKIFKKEKKSEFLYMGLTTLF